jgi:glucose/arabinose dehydrogenase
VAAVTHRRTAVLLPLAGPLLLAGCGGAASQASRTTSAASSSPEPAPTQAAVSAEAASDPAAATDPGSAALSVAVRAADLPAGWSVQANPVPDGALAKNPSFAGIRGATFASESHRTAKHPVTGLDPQGTVALASEAISYDSASSASSALAELRSPSRRAAPSSSRSSRPRASRGSRTTRSWWSTSSPGAPGRK